MKIKTSFLAVILSLVSIFQTNIAQANIDSALNWGEASGGIGAYVHYTTATGNVKAFTSTVSHSTRGEQRLYFQDNYLLNSDNSVCSRVSIMPEEVTLVFDSQAIQMFRMCFKYLDANSYYYKYTPATDRGLLYLVNLLKTATSPVKVQIASDTFYIPSKGFIHVWNSRGGNAI